MEAVAIPSNGNVIGTAGTKLSSRDKRLEKFVQELCERSQVKWLEGWGRQMQRGPSRGLTG